MNKDKNKAICIQINRFGYTYSKMLFAECSISVKFTAINNTFFSEKEYNT